MNLLSRAACWLWRVLAAAVVLGAVVCLVPSPPLAHLTARDHWLIRGEFSQDNHPSARELEPSTFENPHTRFYRSWNGHPIVGAEIRTIPFVAPRVLIVPFTGYPTEAGITLDVECTTDGRKMPIATGNAHETWSRAVIVMPPEWCSGRVQLVAVDDSDTRYIGVGTPFAGSWWDVARDSALRTVFVQTLGFGFAVLPLLALAILFARRMDDGVWLAATAVYGIIAYAAFFVYQLDRYVAAAVFLAVSVGCAWVCVRWLRWPHREQTRRATWAMSRLRIAYMFSLVCALLLDLVDTRVGIWGSAYRFSPAAWSSDHLLPMMVADGLWTGKPVADIIGGLWHVSDRPPLMSGILLVAKPVTELFGAIVGLEAQLMRAIAIATAGMAAIAIHEVVVTYRASSSDTKLRATAILVGLLCPFIIFNTVYTWPKLQAAGLALGAVLGLTHVRGSNTWRAVVAGLLLGEALLMHAGVAFGLLTLPLALRSQGWRWRTAPLAIAGTVAVLLWVPWSLWQRFVDPPGNALLKVLLTGDRVLPGESVLDAFRATIANVTFGQWLLARADAVRSLWGATGQFPPLELRVHDYIDGLRLADFLEPLTTWRFLGLGILAGLVFAMSRRNRTEQSSSAQGWLLSGALGVSVGLIVSWKYNMTHHHSYFSLCCILIASLIFATSLPRLYAWLVLALQAAYVMVVWVIHPMLMNGATRVSAALLATAGVAVLWSELVTSVDGASARLLPRATIDDTLES